MAHYDDWQNYWDGYLLNRHGKTEVQTEDDLYLQVARTWNKMPIEREAFDCIIQLILDDMKFEASDVLVDFCCGNGLFTYELSTHLDRIIAVDFSAPIIETAKKFKSASNIEYCQASATEFMETFAASFPGVVPTKYLMNDALAYFAEADLERMLTGIMKTSPLFTFLIRGVPNDELKWNYYNTDERKAFYKGLIEKGDLTNYGLGKWWEPDEIRQRCTKLGLGCVIRNQTPPVSDFRMDIIITAK